MFLGINPSPLMSLRSLKVDIVIKNLGAGFDGYLYITSNWVDTLKKLTQIILHMLKILLCFYGYAFILLYFLKVTQWVRFLN